MWKLEDKLAVSYVQAGAVADGRRKLEDDHLEGRR